MWLHEAINIYIPEEVDDEVEVNVFVNPCVLEICIFSLCYYIAFHKYFDDLNLTSADYYLTDYCVFINVLCTRNDPHLNPDIN